MGAVVDSIEIQIDSDAKKAESTIDLLIEKMNKFAKSIGSIDVSAISKQAKKISDSFSNVNIKGLENISKSAKQAEESVKKVSSVAKSMGAAKMNFNVSDYQKVIKELSGKFSEAGKDISFGGNLQSLEKQASRISAEFDKLAQKEEKIISVGKTSPQSSVFQNLQYDIALTTNKLSGIQSAIERFKKVSSAGNEIKIIDTNNAVKSLDYFIKELNRFDKEILESESGLMKGRLLETPIKNLNTLLGQLKSTYPEAKDLVLSYEEELKRVLALQEKTTSKTGRLPKATTNVKWTKAESGLGKVSDTGWTKGSVAMNPSYIKKARAELEKYSSNLKNAGNESANFANKSIPSFQKVTSVLKGIGNGALNLTKRMASVSLPFSNMSKGSSSLTRSLGRLSVAFLSLRGIGSIVKESIDISSSLTEVQNVVDVTFGKYSKAIEDFAQKSVQQFGLSELSAKQTAGRFQSMGVALGLPQKEMANMSVDLTKLSADLASFYDVSQSETAKSLQSVFTGTTMPMRKYGVDLTQTTIEEWAHKRGIDAKMKSMTQAEKMMIRYQYVMERTGAAQGDFARTINSWHNQVTLLKEGFKELGGVIGGVFINALKPIVKGLNAAMGHIINFAKMISNALGKIFGWTYEEGGGATNPAEDLSEGMDDVADSTDKATKKQKEFNKQLSKFDELNNYTQDKSKDNDTGDGSGDLSGTGTGGYGGQWKKGDSIVKAYESEISSLYGLGAKIGETLKNALDSIDWNSVYKKAEGFGTGLANFLNGLVETPGLFSSIGTTIAGGLNAALHFLDSFGKTFNWSAFGQGIADGINAFFKTFDFGLLASTFNTWANGILTTMITAVQGVDWKQIASKIAELINGIDASGISWNLGKLVNSLANAFYTLVSNKETWTDLGTKIADGINGFFSGMNDVDPKTGLTGFQALGKSISESISGIAETITTALKGVDWTTVGKSIGDFIASIDFGKVAWDLTRLAANLFSAIVDAVSGFVEKAPLESAIVGLFVGLKLTGLGGIIATAISTALAGKDLSLGKIAIGLGLGAATLKLANEGKWTSSIASGITAFLAAKTFTGNTKLSLKIAAVTVAVAAGFKLGKVIGEWVTKQLATEDMSQYSYDFKFTDLFSYDLEEWKQGVADMVVDFQETLSEKKEEVLQAIADWLVDSGIADIPSKIVGFFSDAWKGIKGIWNNATGFFSGIWTGITNVFKNVGSWFKDKFSTAWKNIKGAWNSTKTFFSNIWTGIKNVFNNVGSWFKSKFGTAWKNIKGAFNNTKTFFSSVWSNIKGAFGNIAEWFGGKFEKAWKAVKNVFSTGGKVFDGIKDGILKGLKDVINGLIKGINKVIETPFNGLNTALTKIKNVSIAGAKPFDKLISKIDVPQIPLLATGGFPEDGWFRASHGEMLGKFDNGQSVVANNMQITKGISDAVQKGNQESVMLMRQEISMLQRQNDLLLEILQKETGIKSSDLFSAVRDEDNAFYKRNGHSAFSW